MRGREVAWEGARVSEFLKLRIQIKYFFLGGGGGGEV